ncbi:MAG: bifunctional riboflavin kinase/FAD synthetase [Pseudomonadota bacterium]|nr:bifunctional riboflavin kinase/FAD synthetase [Pseudomonadota bacterium]
MQLIRRTSKSINSLKSGCVISIGAFDGLHIGHRRILNRLIEKSNEHQLPSLVFSFEPTPKEFFNRGEPPARLMSFREKFKVLEELGLDIFFCPAFNQSMANLEPFDFIVKLLVDFLNIRHVVVGDDFRFARRRSGGIEHLQQKGAEHGFSVEMVSSVIDAGRRVSSTAVRESLESGNLEDARQLLGCYYQMVGKVVEGKKLGRKLGMPTANLKLNRQLSPLQGIFAVRVSGLPCLDASIDCLNGVASIGTRPTIGGSEPLLEIHIFDFDQDIYGEHLQVDFIAKLRDEEHFDNLDTLAKQMFKDAEIARTLLADK